MLILIADFFILNQKFFSTKNFGDWDDVRITISKKNGAKLGEKECAPYEATEQTIYTTLPRDKFAEVVGQSICLEKGVDYTMRIDFKSNTGRGNVQTYVDAVCTFFIHVYMYYVSAISDIDS